MKKVFLTIALTAFFFASGFAQEASLLGKLQFGTHSVGFRVLEKYDYARPYKMKYDYEGKLYTGERARPVQISIWYPAQKGTTPALSFQEYVYHSAKEDSFGELTEQDKTQAIDRFVKSRWAQGSAEDKLRAALQVNTTAYRNAEPAKGSFPLLLTTNSTGISSPFGNAILAEYLASHGYVVASIPTMGSMSKQLDSRETHVQVDDLQFVIDSMHDFPNLDRNKLGLIGFGFGAIGTSLLAMHNKDVDAMVSLDSALASIFGYSILFQSSLYKPNRLTVPVLHISTQKPSPVYDITFFNALKYSNVTYLKLSGMRAVDFSSLAMLGPLVPGFGGPPPEDNKTANPQEGYDAVCRYTLNFLNANMKQDEQSAAFLKNSPDQNGLRPGLAIVEHKAGLRRPPTEEEFIAILNSKGISEAQKIHRQVVQDNAEYRIFDPETLNALANSWIQSQKKEEAIALLKLNLEAYPDDWEVFDMLGKAYQESGNKQLAIEAYNKSLELNPENENATEQLKKLQQS